MGALIFSNTKDVLKRFVKNGWNPDDFMFIVASQSVRVKDKQKNVQIISELCPPATIMNEALGGQELQFQDSYMHYLQVPYIDATLSILVKMAVDEDVNLVFVCGVTEDENIKYFDLIRDYVEAVYEVPTHTLRNLQKKGNKLLKIDGDVTNKALNRIKQRMEMNLSKQADLGDVVEEIINGPKEEIKKKKKSKKKGKKKKKKNKSGNPFI